MTLTRRLTRAALALGAGTTLLFGAAWMLSSKERPIPETQVGFRTQPLNVAHRDQSLDLHLWYPSDAEGPAELIAQNAFLYGFHAHRDATPRAGAFPLVLLSHGSGGRMTQMAWLATQMAEQGYIVAGVNHHGTTSGDSDPHRTVQIWERPADLSAILDRFEAGGIAGLRADMSNITSAGFSLGGHTALALAGAEVRKEAFIDYCAAFAGKMDCGWLAEGGVDLNDIDAERYEASFKDARITATIAIDPALPRAMTRESLVRIAHPSLFINLHDPDTMPAAVDAAQLAAQMPKAQRIVIPGSWHMSAISECSPLGRLVIGATGLFTGEMNICGEAKRHRMLVHRDIWEAVLPFLNRDRGAPEE